MALGKKHQFSPSELPTPLTLIGIVLYMVVCDTSDPRNLNKENQYFIVCFLGTLSSGSGDQHKIYADIVTLIYVNKNKNLY